MSRKLIRPTADEEAAINTGIAKDPDTMVVSDADFAEAAKAKRKRGRPMGSVAEVRKESVTMRLDPDVLGQLRASGPGWQTRANDILRQAVLQQSKHAGKRA